MYIVLVTLKKDFDAVDFSGRLGSTGKTFQEEHLHTSISTWAGLCTFLGVCMAA
jgi:hypothetical protein